jgi:hypothetical protein
MAIWCCLRSFGLFFPILVCLDQEKSGSPDVNQESGKSADLEQLTSDQLIGFPAKNRLK